MLCGFTPKRAWAFYSFLFHLGVNYACGVRHPSGSMLCRAVAIRVALEAVFGFLLWVIAELGHSLTESALPLAADVHWSGRRIRFGRNRTRFPRGATAAQLRSADNLGSAIEAGHGGHPAISSLFSSFVCKRCNLSYRQVGLGVRPACLTWWGTGNFAHPKQLGTLVLQ